MPEYTSLSAFVSISLLSLDLSVPFYPQIGLGELGSQSDALERIARRHYRALVANKGDCLEAIATLGAVERIENAFLTEVATSLPMPSSRYFNRWWRMWATSIRTSETVVELWWVVSIARLVRETAAADNVSSFQALVSPELQETATEMLDSMVRANELLRELRTERDRMTAWDREVIEFTSPERPPLNLFTSLADLIACVSTATWWSSVTAAMDERESESLRTLLTRIASELGCKLQTTPRSWPPMAHEG